MMEAGEENSGNISLKRQRAPLSDSEDNVFLPSEGSDGQKRRRLEAAGQENRSPKPFSSGRLVELETKPDTPMVPSVRSRIQLLTQRQEGVAPLAQRCLSDPGAVSPSAIREHLLGDGEFTQRMERFQAQLFQASPVPSSRSANLFPKTSSNYVSDIQQKLKGVTTPSSKQAVRMRQEREQELNQLHFQPISENAWLKRSSSDPTLTQATDGAAMTDSSFTEATTSSAKKQSSNETGETSCCDSEAPAATTEAGIQQKEQKAHPGKEVVEEIANKTSVGSDEQLRPQKSQMKTVMQLSFSEDQSFFNAPLGEKQNLSELPTEDDQSLLECTYSEESNVKETSMNCRENETDRSEANLFDCSSHNEEAIEASTEEEITLWRYPQECKEESVLNEEEEALKPSNVEEEKAGSRSDSAEPLGNASSESVSSYVMMEKPEEDRGFESCLGDMSKESVESCDDCNDRADDFDMEQDRSDTEECNQTDDACQQSEEIQTASIRGDANDLESTRRDTSNKVNYIQTDVSQADLETNTEYVTKPEVEIELDSSDTDVHEAAHTLTEIRGSGVNLNVEEIEQVVLEEKQEDARETLREEGGESSKKVSFILEPELINDTHQSETTGSTEARVEESLSDAELSSHDETNTAEIIDQMFEEVLEYAGRIEEERAHHEDTEDHDSGIGACSAEHTKMDTESEKDKSEEEGEAKEEEEDCDESKKLEQDGDDLLTFPPSCILSPLSKSVEAVVTPMRLTMSQESDPPSLMLTPEETFTPPVESAPLYSIDAYRTQRQCKPITIQSVTPEIQSRASEKSQPQPSVNTKEKIKALNEEAGKLQTVIGQTLQALSCCTDEEHGRGSLEEAEAEKLLLVSCEKRSALLTEMARLRGERISESGETSEENKEYNTQQPCRGTVSISNIQLPLKVEFVCSSQNRTGRPSHYFFILIRYGPCNIVATPLATAADAKKGDTISFPTSITLKDIRSSFEIDVEVYSLSHTSSNNCTMDKATTKSRVTPRKLLNTITRSGNSLTTAPPSLGARRSSNFSLVGSHKVTLASLGHSKFPLDKMKLEGKIRRLLGDEFQEKVPFLSPLEGNIYLKLDSESHSTVQHQGFLTMFELISGYGVWHRRYFVLEGWDMSYWNHPNDRETKEAEGRVSLSSPYSQCVRPVNRDSCARPFTFELVSKIQEQQQDNGQEASAKCWFSADTKQERLDWMAKLNQVLLDFHTWNRNKAAQTESQQSDSSSGGNLRESIL